MRGSGASRIARSPAASWRSIRAGRSDVIGGAVHFARTLRAGFVLAREGGLALVDPSVLPPMGRAAVRMARLIERRDAPSSTGRLAAALTRLGPSYVKFGQFLATRPD